MTHYTTEDESKRAHAKRLLSFEDDIIPQKYRTEALEVLTKQTVDKYIMNHLSVRDTHVQRVVGRCLLAEVYSQTSPTLAGYLQDMYPLMRARTNSLPVTDKLVIDLSDPNYMITINDYYKKSNEIVKLDTPNETWKFMEKNTDVLQASIDESLDLSYDYHRMSVLAETYLTRLAKTGRLLERPQYMYMRIASQLYGPENDVQKVLKAYREMSNLEYVHASPTIFNAGMTIPQMSSCFLHSIPDTLDGIMNTIRNVGIISKCNGASGVDIGGLRTNTAIGNSGLSAGIKPVVKDLDVVTGHVDQGGKRRGATQMTLPVWHFDVLVFYRMSNKFGKPEDVVKNSHLCIAVNDLFMERVEKDESWSLFCPTKAPKLRTTHTDAWRKAYLEYESAGLRYDVISARKLWLDICEMRTKSGIPFVVSYDNMNCKTNQCNIGDGIIHSMNLCLEIVLKADDKRIPSCNLSSTCLPSCLVRSATGYTFDFTRLGEAVRAQVRNINQVIKYNYCPLPEIKFSNNESAPIGIGAQGYADVLAKLSLPYDSIDAHTLAAKIQACTYYNGLYESMMIARERGYPYQAFPGSPFSKGCLQYDMWESEAKRKGRKQPLVINPADWGQVGNWDELKADIIKYGVANSQITTAQPTASCAQISGMNEAWEPFARMSYIRQVISGEFTVINGCLQEDLEDLGLWSDDIVTYLRINDGSVKGLHKQFAHLGGAVVDKVKHLEKVYKTAYELNQKAVITRAYYCGPYIDASQSTSTYWSRPDPEKLLETDLFANKLGMKTICYYARQTAASGTVKFTLDKDKVDKLVCTRENPDCLACT